MANFCVKCGSPLINGPFCTKCGTDARGVTQSAQVQPNSVSSQPSQATAAARHTSPQPIITPPAPTELQPTAAKNGMSSLAKLGIAAVVIIFVGGAVGAIGVYYIAHKVSQKYHEVSDEILGSSSDSSSKARSGPIGADRAGSNNG